MSASLTLENGEVCVRGSGFGDGGKLDLEIVSTADNGDHRSARHRPQVAHKFVLDERELCRVCGQVAERHTYEAGSVDFTEPLAFESGTVEVRLRKGNETVAEEVFHLG